jgi:glycine/D-amino acid oxidase-like deaminating enzyme
MRKEHQKQEHTSSYYAASVNEITNYPALEGSQSADVCVVGAGFTGVATALTLAERGFSVALVEANRVGWGASGRNGGQLINGIGGLSKIAKKRGRDYESMLWDLKWRGNDIIYDRVEKYGIQCDFKSGFLEVATKPSHVSYFDDGGFLCHRDGHLHPLNLCIGEARAAHELGVQVFEQSPVTGIEHGRRPRVTTASGYVEADSVVLAGNAYSLLEPKHLSNLVFPAGSYIIGTEPLADDVVNEINPKDIAVCDTNEVVDYYRLSADKRLLYGGACNYSGRDPASIKSFILPRMLKVYPQLRNVRIDFEWGGKIGIVLNRIPAVGRINGNVYYCQGYSGHGVNATHVMGEVMADAIGGTMERYDLFADMGHFRLPGSQWVGNQIIALGMLYYKIKDRL